MSQGQRYSHCSGAAPPAWFFSRYTWRIGPLRQRAGSATRRRAVPICSLWTGSSFVSGLVATGARPPRRVAPIRRSLSNILFFGKEYALRSWKGNPAHFPFHANAWKRPYPKTRAPEHIGIYCPCTQVSNSDDSLSGVLESRVRFFRLALLPFPFRCRMVGENRAKEIGRFPSFRNISALSVELLRRRGICGTTGTRSERDAGAAGSPMSGPPGGRPRKGLSRRINETPPSQQEGMAWTHGSTGSVFWVLLLSQDGSFSANRWRKTNLRRGKRTYGRTLRFSPRARGFAGRKGMTVMAMEAGMGTTEPRQASADRCAGQPRSFLESTE